MVYLPASRIGAFALVGALFAAPSGGASSEPIQLKFASPSAPTSALNTEIVGPWAERVTKESEGSLDVKVFPGPAIANYGNVYDRTINGVVDLAWGIFGPLSSQFPKTSVVTLPFETKTGQEAATALWRIYERGVIADEYGKVRLLALGVFPNVSLHAKRPIRSLADLKGLKVSAESRFLSKSVEGLGAAPVTISVTELYNALQRGTIDAAAIAWPAILTYKLDETTSFHLDVSLSNDSGWIAMNSASYARLPAKAQQAIDRASGDVLVKRLITVIGGMFDGARSRTMAQAGHTIATLDPAEEVRWVERVKPVIEDWIRTVPDGPRVLEAYREEVKKVRTAM